METKTIIIIAGGVVGLIILFLVFKKRPQYQQRSNWAVNIGVIAAAIFGAFQLFKGSKYKKNKAAEKLVKEELDDRNKKIADLEEKKQIIGKVLKDATNRNDQLSADIKDLEKQKEKLSEKPTEKKSTKDAANKLKNL